MHRNDTKYNQLFRDRFRDHSLPVREGLWSRIHSGIKGIRPVSQVSRPSFLRMAVQYARVHAMVVGAVGAATVGVIVGVIYFSHPAKPLRPGVAIAPGKVSEGAGASRGVAGQGVDDQGDAVRGVAARDSAARGDAARQHAVTDEGDAAASTTSTTTSNAATGNGAVASGIGATGNGAAASGSGVTGTGATASGTGAAASGNGRLSGRGPGHQKHFVSGHSRSSSHLAVRDAAAGRVADRAGEGVVDGAGEGVVEGAGVSGTVPGSLRAGGAAAVRLPALANTSSRAMITARPIFPRSQKSRLNDYANGSKSRAGVVPFRKKAFRRTGYVSIYSSVDFPTSRYYTWSNTTGFRLTFEFSLRWSFTAGLEYGRVNVPRELNLPGDPPMNAFHFSNYEVPLLLGYRKTFRRSELTINAGAILNLYAHTSTSSFTDNWPNRDSYGAVLGADYSYSLGRHLAVFGQPYVRYSISDYRMFIQSQRYTLGTLLGVRYQL